MDFTILSIPITFIYKFISSLTESFSEGRYEFAKSLVTWKSGVESFYDSSSYCQPDKLYCMVLFVK